MNRNQNKKYLTKFLLPAILILAGIVFNAKYASAFTLPKVPHIPKIPKIPGIPKPPGFPGLPGLKGYNTVPVTIKEYVSDTSKDKDDQKQRQISRDTLDEMLNVLSEMVSKTGNQEKGYQKDGDQSFVSNWQTFIQGEQDRGRDLFINGVLKEALFHPTRGTICEYLVDDIARIFNVEPLTEEDLKRNYNSQYRIDDETTFRERVRCTLPEYIIVDGEEMPFDIEKFREDMNYGGYEVLSLLSEPQNNLYGLVNLIREEKSRQVSRAEEQSLLEVTSNNGYRGIKNEEGNIEIPGAILKESHAAIVNSQLEWLISTDESLEMRYPNPRAYLRNFFSSWLKSLGLKALEIITGKISDTLKDIPLIPDIRLPENKQ